MLLWHLDDPSGATWTDSSGNNRPSKYYNATSVAGLFGTAATGWPAAAGILSPTYNPPTDVTAEAWVYWPAGTTITGPQVFFERRTGGTDPFILYTGAMAVGQGVDGQVTVDWGGVKTTTTAASPLFEAGKWYHVALTAKNTGAETTDTTLKIYVTAADQTAGGPVCVLTIPGAKDLIVSSRPFRIGADPGSSGRMFKGYIDEARMSSVALTWFDSFGPAPTTCTLTGDVLGGSGALVGATVQANGRVGTTDASGHYELTDVPITSDLQNVTVKASGHFAQTQTVPDVQSGGSYYFSWTMNPLPDPCTISGIISDAVNPLASMAGVAVRCSDGQTTTTDANGAYAFANVPTYNGNVTVTAWSAAYRTGSGTVVAPQASTQYDLPIALTPLTGIVRNPNSNPYDELLMHFDELTGISWADSSGNGRHGHSVANIPGVPGLLGGAAGPFTGQYTIDTPVYATLAGQDMTVEAYVYWPTGAVLTGEQIIAGRRNPDAWCLTYNKLSSYGVTGEFNFCMSGTAWTWVNTTGATVVNDQWYHVAATVRHLGTNNNEVKIYVTPLPANPADPMPAPVLRGSATGRPDIKAVNTRTYVGTDALAANRFFKGYIDELRVSKIALTHFDLYGPPSKCTISGIVSEDGDPTARIAGAVVTNNVGGTTTTDATGAYAFVDAPIYTEPITITVTAAGFRTAAPATISNPVEGASYSRDFALIPSIRKIWSEVVYWQSPQGQAITGGVNSSGNPMAHAQQLIDGNKSIIAQGQGGLLVYADEQTNGTAFVRSTPYWSLPFPPNYATKGGCMLNGRLYAQSDNGGMIHQGFLPNFAGGIGTGDGPWGPGMATGRDTTADNDANALLTDGTYLYGSISGDGGSSIYKWSVDPAGNGGTGALTQVWKTDISTTRWFMCIGYYNGKLYAAENGGTDRNIYEIDCATGAATTILTPGNYIPNENTPGWVMGQVARCGNRIVLVDWSGHLTQWVLEAGIWVLKANDAGISEIAAPANYLIGLSLKPGADGNARYAWISGSNKVYFYDLRPTSKMTNLGDPDNWKNGYTTNVEDAVVTTIGPASGGQTGFWVENQGRTAGAHVLWTGAMPSVNSVVTLKGSGSKTSAGERTLTAAAGGVLVTSASTGGVAPLMMTHKSIGPATGGVGLANDGMLVKISGRVTGISGGEGFFIDDGSGVPSEASPALGVKVMLASGGFMDAEGVNNWQMIFETPVPCMAVVTGVVRLEMVDGNVYRRIDARSAADIVITAL